MNKKLRKKIFSFVFLLVITILLSACDKKENKTTEEIFLKVSQNFGKVSSMSYTKLDKGDIYTNSAQNGNSAKVTVKGESNIEINYILEPFTMQLKDDKLSSEEKIYINKPNDKYFLYTYTFNKKGKGTWRKVEVPYNYIVQRYDSKALIELCLTQGHNYEENGREIIDGTEAVRYDGFLSGDSIHKVLEFTDAAPLIESIPQKDITELIMNLDNQPISIWVDTKNDLPVKYEMDMTEILQKLMKSIKEKSNKGEFDFLIEDYKINKLFLSMVINEFNSVKSIKIPEEALKS